MQLDDKGLYDADKGLGKLKQFVKNEEDFAKFEKIGKLCSKGKKEFVFFFVYCIHFVGVVVE